MTLIQPDPTAFEAEAPARGPQPYVPLPPPRPYLPEDPRLKSPVVATLLSAMPGLGQVYLGYTKQGFINALVIASLITLLAANAGALTPLLALFMAFFWLYNMVDAGRKATVLNQVLHRLEATELPEGFGTMGFRAQVLGGLALVVVGMLALAHLRFDMPLDWIARWWPVGFVLGGIYLVWTAAMDRKN